MSQITRNKREQKEEGRGREKKRREAFVWHLKYRGKAGIIVRSWKRMHLFFKRKIE